MDAGQVCLYCVCDLTSVVACPLGCLPCLGCQHKDTGVVPLYRSVDGYVVISCQDKDTGVVLLYWSVDGLCSY